MLTLEEKKKKRKESDSGTRILALLLTNNMSQDTLCNLPGA